MIPIEQLRMLLKASTQARVGLPDIEAQRRAMLDSTAGFGLPAGVSVTQTELGGVRGLRLTPDRAEPGAVILYLHGGGYVLGSPQTHRSLVGHLARLSHFEAVSMDYRLAPEHPFPAAPEDGLSVYRALLDSGDSPARIVIAGDSAGGGLALATALKARSAGLPQPAGLALLSPWTNLANTGWSYDANGENDPAISRDRLDALARLYLGKAQADDALASPLHADLKGLAPLLIQVGGEEVLLSDATTLAERAGAANVEVSLEVWPQMMHVFQVFNDLLEEARAANARLAGWMRTRVGLTA